MEIAVVGMACRYPGADSPLELFQNVLAGRQQFREIPLERWRLEDYYDADRKSADRTYSKQAALISGFQFEPARFRIPQSTARASDVAQWLALTVAADSLADAGIADPPRHRTSVILGNTLAGETSRANLVRFRWPYVRRIFQELLEELAIPAGQQESILLRVEERYKQPFVPVNEDNLAGSLANTIAGRICNYFDFHGGGFTVDGACSSSLLAISQACAGLEAHHFDLALAGGVDVSLDPFELVGFAKVGALSDSDIRVYDQRANGFLPGEGCGILVLQRLAEAVSCGRRVYCVIRGAGCSSDGRGGITAPSVLGQSLALDRAYEQAGYSFADVELIEGHGTGTPLGDRTELLTFIEGKRRHSAAPEHHCGLGSVKSIVGHTKAAAGVAGFIKAAQAVYHRVLPPTFGVSVPNELFNTTRHLYPLLRARRWPGDAPARAAVSSAGFGGINTHVTFEGHGTRAGDGGSGLDVELLTQTYQDTETFFLGADQLSELRRQVEELLPISSRIARGEILDLAAHCAHQVQRSRIRLAVVAQSPGELHHRLSLALARLEQTTQRPELLDQPYSTEGVYLSCPRGTPRIAFMFPGQGSQRLHMGGRWRDRFAFARSHWEQADRAVTDQLPEGLSPYVFPDMYWENPLERPGMSAALRDTRIAQPAIVAASMVTADVLNELGLEASLVIGHSLGEYTALWHAGVLDKAHTVKLAARRGSSMAAAANERSGGMISIAAGPEEVSSLLPFLDGYAAIANLNAPSQTVVSGEALAIQALSHLCAQRGWSCTVLDVSGAFHSRLMDSARYQMAPILESSQWYPRRRQMVSTVTGALVTDLASLPHLLTRQIVAPVRFLDGLQAAQREHIDAFIEVGPGTALCGLARRIFHGGTSKPAWYSHPAVLSTDGSSELEWSGMCHTLGWAYAHGAPIVPDKVFAGRFYKPFKLPYEPCFIASPCEMPTSRLQLDIELSQPLQVIEKQQTSGPVRANGTDAEPRAGVAEGPVQASAIVTFVQTLIAHRFGYPLELILPHARLGEDLGLDSIKSAEVIAETLDFAQARLDPTRLSALTLEQLASEISRSKHSPQPEPGSSLTTAPSWVRAFEVQMQLAAVTGATREIPRGTVLLIDPDSTETAIALVEQLERVGLSCVVHTAPWGQPVPIRGDLSGCIVLCPADAQVSPLLLDDADVQDGLFELPRFLLGAVRTALQAGLGRPGAQGFFVLATRSDGLGGRGESLGEWRQSPAAGAFAKSFHLEHPELITRVLDLDFRLSPQTVAERIVDELTSSEPFQEAGYAMSGLRFVPLLASVPRTTLDLVGPAINDSDVVLATGGAKGITAVCIEALAAGSHASFALIGSSATPKGPSNEISATLARLEAAGVRAQYYCCDLTRPEEIRACLGSITRDLGPVTVLVHGAGVNVPRRVEQIEPEHLQRVLAPKMGGLLYLLRSLDTTRLRQIALLSSVIGHTGMAGNADYAYANAWTTQLLRHVEDTHPQITCRAFAFSVWADIGMGQRLNSIASLARLGVDPIAPAAGAHWFADLMQRQWPNVEILVASRMGGLATAKFAGERASRSRWFEQVLLFQPGVEVLTQATLSPERDPFLKDHNYQGAYLLPAVVGMEAMAQVAAACAESLDTKGIRPRLEELRFDRPIVIPPGGRSIWIHAFGDEPSSDGSVRVHVSISTEVAGVRTEAFSGDCLWSASTPAWGTSPVMTVAPLPFAPDERLYGSIFFQGSAFRNIEAFYEVSERHCLARVRVSRRAAQDANSGALLLDAWEVRDCFLHCIQICVPHLRLLPLSIESLETQGYADRFVYIRAQERLQEGRDYLYDLEVFDESGGVIEAITGYRCRVVDRYHDDEVIEYVRAIHAESARRRSTHLTSASASSALAPTAEEGHERAIL